MSDQSKSAIPDAWRRAAEETAKALSVARAIERSQYPGGDAPAGLVAVLALAAVIRRSADEISDFIGELPQPMQLERLAGIENELYRLADKAGDALMLLTAPTRRKARGDGK